LLRQVAEQPRMLEQRWRQLLLAGAVRPHRSDMGAGLHPKPAEISSGMYFMGVSYQPPNRGQILSGAPGVDGMTL
jgi:hypothetical protein